MKVSELVAFRRDLFFEGAVQIGWATSNRPRAELAATNFIFHGPEFQAVKPEDFEDQSLSEQLTDTCSFVASVVENFSEKNSTETNPFMLAIAGYGTGKSHLGLTLSLLLSERKESPLHQAITKNLRVASSEVSARIESAFESLKKPFLCVSLDGMQDFNLGAEFNRQVLRELRRQDLDLTPVELLSPRFRVASDFVEKNYSAHRARFNQETKCNALDEIQNLLIERSEEIFNGVNRVFKDFAGMSIPLSGQESPQDLITCVCENYCGPNKEFTGFIVVFDEFGRYLEFASDSGSNAGPSALQQIYQGIQDNSEKSLFLGLIQYELRAYLNKAALAGDTQLGKYIGRYDSSRKFFLSSNLETLLAHLITKQNSDWTTSYLDSRLGIERWRDTFDLMSTSLPVGDSTWVWTNFEEFRKVIVRGCWPLDPLAVWFLSKQQDIVQNRSALSFVATEIDSIADRVVEPESAIFSIRAADFCLGPMFEEILAAERVQHGTIAESFATIREDFKDRLTKNHLLVLASIVVSQKIRTAAIEQRRFDDLISALSGLDIDVVRDVIKELTQNYCVVEWNDDLRRYELIVGAVTRSQFHSFLNKKSQDYSGSATAALQIFQQYGSSWSDLPDIDPQFSNQKQILTSEWKYQVNCASRLNLKQAIADCVKACKSAESPDSARGQLIYCLALETDDLGELREEFQRTVESECARVNSPLLPLIGVILFDSDSTIRDTIIKLQVLRTGLSADDKEKYSKFLDEERSRQSEKLQNAISNCVKARDYIFSKDGLVERKDQLRKVCFNVFDKVYSEIIPFKFDGFATTRGNAAKDCAVILRALVNGGVSQTWATSQIPSVLNRFNTLFQETWKALTDKYEFAKHPKLPVLNRLFEKIDAKLAQEESVNLGDLHRMLIEPPYGMNSASAGLVIGMILGRRSPSLSIRYDGVPMQREVWIADCAFEDKKPFFNVKALSQTQVRVISGDTKTQWRALFDDWAATRDPFKKRDLMNESEKLRREIGMPSEFEAECSLLVDATQEATDAVLRHVRKVQKLLDFKLQCEDSPAAEHLLSLAQQTQIYISEIDRDRKHDWPDSALDELSEILPFAKQELLSVFPRWLQDQRCNNPMAISKFKAQMDSAQRTLEGLGLKEFAMHAERHYQRVNTDIEIHQKHKSLFPEVDEFLNFATTDDTTLHVSLEENIRRGQTLLELLEKYSAELKGDQGARERHARVTEKIDKLKNVRKRQRERCSALTERTLDSPETLSSLLRELAILQQVFAGKEEDCEYLSGLCAELRAYEADIVQCASFNVAEEQLEQIVEEQKVNRLKEFSTSGIDVSWDIDAVYDAFKLYGIESLRERSERWLVSNKPVDNPSKPLTQRQLMKSIEVLEDVPIWFSRVLMNEVCETVNSLRNNLSRMQESEVEAWFLTNVPAIENIESFTEIQCRDALHSIQRPPSFTTAERKEALNMIKQDLERRLDSLNFQDLLERCKRLSDEHLKLLIAELQLANSETA